MTTGKQKKRVELAEKILLAMIASPPECDRSEADTDAWADKAFEFADSFLEQADAGT